MGQANCSSASRSSADASLNPWDSVFPNFDAIVFWNTIFDKLLLAGAVVTIGYVVNRWLERYRADMALATEAAKIRLDRLGRLWEETSAWEANVKGLFVEFAAVTMRELRDAGVEGLPSEDDGAIQALLDLSKTNLLLPPPDVEERILAIMGPKKKAHAERGTAIWRDIDRYRFWIGEDLFGEMKRYHLAVQAADMMLDLTPEGIQRATLALNALDDVRRDVNSAIDHILGSRRR